MSRDHGGADVLSDYRALIEAATREAVAVAILDVRDAVGDINGMPGAYRDGLRDAAAIARRVTGCNLLPEEH